MKDDGHPRPAVVGDAATGRVALWNPAAEVLFGYPVEDTVGMPIQALVPEGLKAAPRVGIARYALGRGPYIARMIVEAHGGRISAKSEVGRGGSFTATISRFLLPSWQRR